MSGMYRSSIGVPVLALLGLLIFGCASAPEPAPPDTAFERRTSGEPSIAPEHEPFVKIVDTSRLRVGMTKEEVLEVFPDPERIEISPRDREVWEYEFAQLHFNEGRLEDWFNTPGSGM